MLHAPDTDGEEAMAQTVRAVTPLLMVITLTALIIALALISGGVALVWLHGTGETEFNLIGNQFKSENVGVVGIFCGAVLGVLSLRTLIKSVVQIAGEESAEPGKKLR
jgi:hypothetical protein